MTASLIFTAMGRAAANTMVAHLRSVRITGNLEGNVTKIPRRQFLRLAAGAAALPAVSSIAAWAQSYPSRAVRIIGVSAGGGPDVVTRLLSQWLSERLGQPFIVENRP